MKLATIDCKSVVNLFCSNFVPTRFVREIINLLGVDRV